MTSSADRWACDTSVAIAALDPNHEAHAVCRRALVELRPALAGHAAFEAHAVLTRLPLPLRLSPEQASQVLARAFPEPCWLDALATADLWSRLGELGLTGGATYDALVAAAARTDGRRLLTRDRRAERTYRAIEVDYQFVE
jgi:predicted nucleic acid-binding protein